MTMNTEHTIQDPRHVVGDVVPLRDAEADLRRACAEMLLAGAVLLSDVARVGTTWNENSQAKQSEERFRKALEAGREALS